MDIMDLKTINRFSIVIIGNLNPAILHPEWFDRNQILPPSEIRDIIEIRSQDLKELEGMKVRFIGSNTFVSAADTRLGLPSYTIKATPERFEASTTKKEKFEELAEFVTTTFKVLEHTPVSAIGINFDSVLKFSQSANDLVKSYFCVNPESLKTVLSSDFALDTRIRYNYKEAKVNLFIETKSESDEIGFNFNYHIDFSEEEGTEELRKYLLDNFKQMMMDTNSIIEDLFGNPIEKEVGHE